MLEPVSFFFEKINQMVTGKLGSVSDKSSQVKLRFPNQRKDCVRKSIKGISSLDKARECLPKILNWINDPAIGRHVVRKNHSTRTRSHKKEKACLRKLLCLSYLASSQLSINKTSAKRTKLEICTVSVVQPLKASHHRF